MIAVFSQNINIPGPDTLKCTIHVDPQLCSEFTHMTKAKCHSHTPPAKHTLINSHAPENSTNP